MITEKRIQPDPRLEKLARMAGNCRSCADVGSDHGRLGVYMLQNRQCERVVMTDISEASLQKARKLVRLLDLEDKVGFSVGDGLAALNEACEVIVIAGMGGETIASIMNGAREGFENSRFLLQANVAIPQLRKALNEYGFRITDEALVRDGRRVYVILEARAGEQQLSEAELEIGPVLIKGNDPLLADSADFRIRVLNKALSGAEKGEDTESVSELKRQKRIWEEKRKCL